MIASDQGRSMQLGREMKRRLKATVAPLIFLSLVADHFETESASQRRMPNGRIRAQFKSTTLKHPFVDQAEET